MNRETIKEKFNITLILGIIFLCLVIPIIVFYLISAPPIPLSSETTWNQTDNYHMSPTGYQLTMTAHNGSTYWSYIFSGTLTLDGYPIEGKMIGLYIDGAYTGLTNVTDVNGDYSIRWTPSQRGTFTFRTHLEN